jgi:hypothetical protein
MTARGKLWLAVIGLVLTGAGLATYKCARLGVPFWRGEQVHEWQVEARVSFLATGSAVKARLSVPADPMDGRRGQAYGSVGYNFNIEEALGEYTAFWSAVRRDEGQVLYFRVRIPDSHLSGGEPMPGLVPEGLDVVVPGGSVGRAAKSIVTRAKETTSDPDALFVSIFEQIHAQDAAQEFLLVRRHYEQEHGTSAPLVMGVDLLSAMGVPARIAYGVRLNQELGAQAPVPLVEYFEGGNWKVRDPLQPASVLDGRRMYVWHRGGGPLLEVSGGENSRVTFTVAKGVIPMSTLTDLQDSPILISTIMGLPLSERAVFRYIVLIPLGAFVVVLLRNIVGIPTLGTFMPVLIALALLEIPPERGLVMFAVLIAAGLWFRFLLSRLNLLVVPRVAACVVIVTLLMMLMSVVSYKLGLEGGGEITLFPMIILAWTIERMSLIWEEEGKRSALVQVSGSLVVALLAYLFMKVGQIQYWAFYFPELLLVLLAGILVIGRYTGYRWSELIRFKSFADAS